MGGGGLWGADGPCLGVRGLERPAENLGGVGGAEALDRVPEEGFPCRVRHGGLPGGFVGVGWGAGADPLEGMQHVHPFPPSRSRGPLHPAAELPQGGGRPSGEVGGGLGGEGLRARGAGAAVAGSRAGGWVRAAGGAGSSVGLVGGGGGGYGTAVAGVAASGGAGAAVAGAGGGGWVRGARGAGRTVLPAGGGGCGHGTAVACVAVPGGAGAARMGPWGVVAAPRGARAVRVSS